MHGYLSRIISLAAKKNPEIMVSGLSHNSKYLNPFISVRDLSNILAVGLITKYVFNLCQASFIFIFPISFSFKFF